MESLPPRRIKVASAEDVTISEIKNKDREDIMPDLLVNTQTGQPNAAMDSETPAPLPKQGDNVVAPRSKGAHPPRRRAKAKSAQDFELIDIDPASPEVESSQRLQTLLQAIQELWTEKSVGFPGQFASLLSGNRELKLAAMVAIDPQSDGKEGRGDAGSLIGFILYRINREKKYLSIRRLAIAPEYRRQGRAGQLLNWCLRIPGVCYLTVTSISRAVEFYRAFGFRKVQTWHEGGTGHPDDEPEGNQAYMEYHPGTYKGKKTKAIKSRR
jgi:ribosomal protein S18 acetylase RimI-like enzyme